MKLSIYTFVKNGLFYDFHVAAMLRHHLPLADEIVVNEGYSSDGTYEVIRDIDPKIKIHRSQWDQTTPGTATARTTPDSAAPATGASSSIATSSSPNGSSGGSARTWSPPTSCWRK